LNSWNSRQKILCVCTALREILRAKSPAKIIASLAIGNLNSAAGFRSNKHEAVSIPVGLRGAFCNRVGDECGNH
jgi:hypothetical protein